MSNLDVRHPEDGLLLRYLDGELPGRKARQVRTHLEACWQCRAQVRRTARHDRRLRAVSQECAGAQPAAAAGTVAQPGFRTGRRRTGCAILLAPPGRVSSRRARIRGLRWALSGAAVLALCLRRWFNSFAKLPKWKRPPCCKRRSRHRESRPAAVKRLRITTRTGQMTRVIGVAHKPAARETEIARLFDAAHYDWNDPLSAKSYAAWRGQLPHFQDAIASQPNSYEIKTTTEDSELLSATLKLRTTDLEPLEGRFEFRNRDWVEMTELVDQQTNPASTVAGTTGGMPRQPGVPPGPSERPRGTAGTLGVLRRTASRLRAPPDWARTWAILSKSAARAGRCWSPAPGFRPNGNNRFMVCWTACPMCVVRFDDPAFPASAMPVQSEPATRDAAGPEKSTYAARIEERLGGRPQFERFSSSVLDWTDSAMTRAYALRRLAQQFSAAAENQMTAEDRRTLRKLGREHLAAFAKDAQRVANTVKPVLTGMGRRHGRNRGSPGANRLAVRQ